MPSPDRVVLDRIADECDDQARACARLGSALYADLLPRVAEDIRSGGPCAEAVRDHVAAEGDASALRLLGAVHALVLSGRALELAAYYPSAGGGYTPGDPERADTADRVFRLFRATVADHLDHVRDWMTRPPQTNEVGRANLLIAGLLDAVSRYSLPIRLFELGASAGLNLRADAFRCTAAGTAYAWGDPHSPVLLAEGWRGALPPWLPRAAERHPYPTVTVAERVGCDLSPVDPGSAEGALALRAYVWPDQTARRSRLDGALEVAARIPAEVRRQGADEFLRGLHPVPGRLTVVWHSVMRQYVPVRVWAQVDAEIARLAAESTPDAPFVHLAFEPHGANGGAPFLLTSRDGSAPERSLAAARPHGLPAWLV